ncbi:GxxExxY protein [Niabella aquatica]
MLINANYGELMLNTSGEILFKDESYMIVGACMRVHSALGPGFLESVYMEALEKEFGRVGIVFEREKKLQVMFDGIILKKYFKADFLCYNEIIVEVKAMSVLIQREEKHVLNYLRASNKKLGILVNFGEPSLKYKRILNSRYSHN